MDWYLDPHEPERRVLAGHDALGPGGLRNRLHGEAHPNRIRMLQTGTKISLKIRHT
jgi:hypothetical protein